MKNSLLLFVKNLKSDIYRCITSMNFWISIVGIVSSLFLGVKVINAWETSVMYIFARISLSFIFLLVFIFCTSAYGISFCEDLENNYIVQQVVRGSLSRYVIAKSITIIISSLAVLMVGIVIFVLILHIFFPWYLVDDSIYSAVLRSGGLKIFVRNEQFILYYLFFGLQYGILIGNLALLSSFVSLYISNRLLLFSLPIMSYYVLSYVFSLVLPSELNLTMFFNPMFNVFNNDIKSFFATVIIGSISSAILCLVIYRKLRRRMENE
jgi:hypothetical protein